MTLNPFDSQDAALFDVSTHAPGPSGSLPLTAEMLRERPSGDLFGWSQNAGMGWSASALGGREFLMLSTHGGIRAPDGTPIALGYHTGHWEVGLLMEAAAGEFSPRRRDPVRGGVHRSVRRPLAGHAGDVRQPAVPQRRRHDLPSPHPIAADAERRARRRHVRQGAAGDDDGAGREPRSAVRARARRGDAPADCRGGRRPRAEHRRRGSCTAISSLEQASDLGCRACASPGGGCQFLGTAATAQVVGEALGLSLGHSALSPSGQPIWLDLARRSARALMALQQRGIRVRDILTEAAVEERDGHPRGVRRIHQPAAARPGDRACRGPAATRPPATGHGSTAACRGWWTRCRTARATTRRCRSSWPAACRR